MTELRSHKQRLFRQLRDKEEEVDALNQKLEALRLDLRKAERTRKEVGRSLRLSPHSIYQICQKCNSAYFWIYVLCQMEAQSEEHASEAQKEKKLRDRSEQYSRQLEEELAAVKVYKSCSHPLIDVS